MERRLSNQDYEYPALSFNFGKLNRLIEQRGDEPPVVMLGRFVTMVFQERNDGRSPEQHEDITLRHADDVAVAAMFNIEHPNITEKTQALVRELDVVPDEEVATS